MMNVLKGMSVGAMVPVLELFAINAFEELEPLLESPEGELMFLQKKEGYVKPPPPIAGDQPERCSSVSVHTGSTTMLAHNEHWLAGDIGNVAVVIDRPERRPRPGCLTHDRVLPAGGRHERTRGGAGHRLAHRLRRRRGCPACAGEP